jgi:hypothetical protein
MVSYFTFDVLTFINTIILKLKMTKFTLLLTVIIITVTSQAQWGDCGLINLSATGTTGNNYSFQVGSNVDSLVAAGTITPNVQHRWRAYHYNNFQDLVNQSFDTSSVCSNCLWSSTFSEDTYVSNIMMDTLTMMLNMTILDDVTCITIFGVVYDPSSNNNSNGGISMSMMNQSTSVNEIKDQSNKKFVAAYNMLGEKVEVNLINNEILIFVYDDGSTEKKLISRF